MMRENIRQKLLCQELQRLGYAPQHRVRLYGDEFELVSNPYAEGDGYAVKGISRKSATVRNVRIPLSILNTIGHEIFEEEEAGVMA